MKIITVLFPPPSSHFILLGSNYSPQQPVPKHPQSVFFLTVLLMGINTVFQQIIQFFLYFCPPILLNLYVLSVLLSSKAEALLEIL